MVQKSDSLNLYWISLHYATFGIVVDDDLKVVGAAPIGQWMIGKDISYIQNWVKLKKGTIREVK